MHAKSLPDDWSGLTDMDTIQKIRVQELRGDDGILIKFIIGYPNGVSQPNRERGESALKSTIQITEFGEIESLSLRYPPLRVSDFESESDAETEFKNAITQSRPPSKVRAYTSLMEETTVPHVKTDPVDSRISREVAQSPADWLSFLRRSIRETNKLFTR